MHIAYVIDEQVFLYGEEWGLNNRKDFVGQGWCICTLKTTFTDKHGNEQKVLKIKKFIQNGVLIKNILNIYAGNEVGIGLICDEYAEYLDKSILMDKRFSSLKKLAEKVGLTRNSIRDAGMKLFIDKAIDQVLRGIYTSKEVNDA